MPLSPIADFLPLNALAFIQLWTEGYALHIRVTKARQSKLGDYRKLKGSTHRITINGNLEPQLFFFVLTHEIAHLKAEAQYKNIAPHGKEWKATFREMLLESLSIYDVELQAILSNFAKNPRASFGADAQLAKYFLKQKDTTHLVEDLSIGETFIYRDQEYKISEKRKKRYLCLELSTGRFYLFGPHTSITPKK